MHMNTNTDTLIRGLIALDQRVLKSTDFETLLTTLVDWACEAGADGAYVGTPDAQGWLRPGPLAGDGMREYVEGVRASIYDTCDEGRGPAGLAWRTQQAQIAVPDASSSAAGVASWRACAAVPLCRDGQCVGVFCLFGRDADCFAAPDWTTALGHVLLVASAELDRLHLGVEHDRLREFSLRDQLTGLPNKTALAHHLERAVPRALRADTPLVIGLLDFDRFKPVNDLFGHEAGDHVLREMARRLQVELRASDFLARLSGDEFVIVLEGVRDPVHVLGPFLDRLHARLAQPVEIGDLSWHCGVSLGLALWPNASMTNPADVLSEADRALRESKLQKDQRTHWWSWASSGTAPAPRGAMPGARESMLYGGDGWPELTSLSEALQRDAAGVVSDFYGRLSRLPKTRMILDALTPAELQHLKSQQIQNLFTLAGAGLTEADHRMMALRVGRIHAMVGLDREELVRSRGILAAAVHSRLGRTAGSEALPVFNRRLTRDLAYQTEAYQHLQDERQDVLLRVARLAWVSESYTDLIHRVVELLGAHDEVAGCSIGRPDRLGVFRVEAASGRILEKHRAECEPGVEDAREGGGLSGSAWRSGVVERCVNVATDPRMGPWRAIAMHEGLRSSAAIPLCQPGHPPMAILTLHSAFPGGYSSADQIAFTDLLQMVLAFAVGRIANQQGQTSAIPYATRQQWATLLRSGALQMYCQPILDLKTGRVTKVEMLARLFDGSRLLTPQEFFPALTSDDFFELYVRGLAQALSDRQLWLRSGIEIDVSVNLPSSALGDIRYFEATQRALATHGCPPGVLTLEILETDALPADVDVPAELARFRALGVELAEDDLGAGHSSLSRLRELPFDWIKIDRSIVNLAGPNTSRVLNFIYQLTRLGHSLGKSVIVEGVEDDALFEAVVILGADAVQGYGIGRPMPAHELVEWMGRRLLLPDPSAPPRSALGRLARLVIWEERLHLVLGDPGAAGWLSEIFSTAPAAADVRVPPTKLRAFCEACPLSKFFVGIEAGSGADTADSSARQALLHAALTHGLGSTAYRIARQRLPGL